MTMYEKFAAVIHRQELTTIESALIESLANLSNSSASQAIQKISSTTLANVELNVSGAIWGQLTGTLSNQTDLQVALNLKANLASPTFTGTVVLPATTSIDVVSATEISYLNGVTSAIQTQIDAKFTLPSFTAGSVLFSNGTTIAQDNANFFWDDTNNRLGIGLTNPSQLVTLGSTGALAWDNGSGTADAMLFRQAANTISQRNGTAAQSFQIYHTYTDASNYERFRIVWSSNRAYIITGAAGTGTNRDIVFGDSESGRWYIEGTTGKFLGEADNSYDIGASGANRPRSLYLGTDAYVGGKIKNYSGVATAGWGVPAIYGTNTPATGQTARSAAVAVYTIGAADGDFEVSGQVTVSASTTHSFSLDVDYTDAETNTVRVLILPMAQLAGSFITGGLITNVTGVGPYESPVMHIRAKTGTTITIRPSAGTFTSVTYGVSGIIKQTQ